MAKNQQQTPLESLFKELDNFIQESEFKKAIKVCDKILSVQSDDADAFTCKVICLMKDSQFEQALTFLDSPNNRALSQNLAFERAYCYYSTKRYADSLNVIKNVARPKPPRILELEAQILYRLENFSQCITTYEDLMNTHKIDTAELKTNLLAAYTDEGRINEGISLIKNSKSDVQDSFEVAFNGACVHIANRDYKSAETLLLLAKKVCTEENSDSEETLQEELAPILVQLGYCYQMLGKSDEAMELYKEVLQSKTKTESTSAAVAANNSVVIKGSHDLFDSLKKLNKAETVEQKLSTMQKKVIGYNKCLTYLHMNKPDEVRKQIENLKGGSSGNSNSSSSSNPNSSWGSENEERLIIISAALLAREKKTDEAFKLLNEFKSKHDKNKSYLSTQLTLAQMYLEKNDLLKVLESLQEIGLEHSHRAAIVSSIVALQEKMGNVEGAVRTLNENVLWYENLISKGSLNQIDEQAYSKVVTRTGDFHIKQKRFKEAAEMYERLVKKNRNDLIALPSLIIATTHYDPSTAEKLSKRLPPLSGDSKINTDILENSAPPKLDKKEKEKEKEKEKVEDDKAKKGDKKGKEKVSDKQKGKGKEVQSEKKDLEVEKKKKKKKKRLPKNYNPNVRPDPERWLPKHERAAYKNRKKKHGADQGLGKGSQGVVPTSSATTVSSGSKPQPPPASSTNRIPDAKPYKPPNAGKKKKGKGVK